MEILFLIFYIICSVLAYGITFAHFQRAYPFVEKEKFGDRVLGIFMGMFGPVGLIMAFIFSGGAKHGFKFK